MLLWSLAHSSTHLDSQKIKDHNTSMSDYGELEEGQGLVEGEEEDVEQLNLSQLKSETVRLEKAAVRLETMADRLEARKTAVRERMERIIATNRGTPGRAGGGPKRGASPCREVPPHDPQRPRKKFRPQCTTLGCTNIVAREGLCERHGTFISKRCAHAGCALHVQSGGLCYRHGAAAKPCSVAGCTNKVQRKGLCYRHGAREGVHKCTRPSCRNVVRADGLCRKHLEESRAEAALYRGEVRVPDVPDVEASEAEAEASDGEASTGEGPFVPI